MSSICELLKGGSTIIVKLEHGMKVVLPRETGEVEKEKARWLLSTLDRA